MIAEMRHRLIRTALMRTVRLRYAIDRRSFYRKNALDVLQGLAGAWAGKPALVVGNGPSLNNTPLDEFVGVPSIGMNKIDLLYSRVNWRPSLVLCVNNLVAAQNQDAWLAAGVPVFLSWKCRIGIRQELRSKFSYFLSLASPDFSTNIVEGVGSSATVTYAALQFAFYMGADPVVIVGVDHSFVGGKEGRENIIEKRRGPDLDHFDSNYFAPGQHWGVPNLAQSEEGYRFAKRIFEANGRRIFDATVGGRLQIFDKLDVTKAIQMVREATR